MDEDDIDFSQAVGPVQPVRKTARYRNPFKPPPVPFKHIEDERAVLDELLKPVPGEEWLETGEEVRYLRPGLRPQLLKRLRRGDFRIEDTIDLHHLNVEGARQTLQSYLAWVRREGLRCVKIIHGKGLRSRGPGPVLKNLTARFLRKQADVLAFVSPVEREGGTGAVLVLVQTR